MSRVTVLTVLALLTYVLAGKCLFVDSLATTMSTSARADQFRRDYVVPTFGDSAQCVEIVPAEGDWFALRVASSADCEQRRSLDHVLMALAASGRHLFKELRRGNYSFAGVPIEIGPAPEHSPAYTGCTSSGSQTELLNPQDGLGILPGEVMSDGRDLAISPGHVFAHEAGHVVACPVADSRSKSEALAVENWYRLQHQPGGALRILHDPPPLTLRSIRKVN
jgi:hypothetical protein